jgi:hypothetical protein
MMGQPTMVPIPPIPPNTSLVITPAGLQRSTVNINPIVPPPSIIQPGPTQMSSMVRPPSRDPWQNTNPWPNPLAGQSSMIGSNAMMPPASSIGPSYLITPPGPQPNTGTAANYAQMANTPLISNTYPTMPQPVSDPWRNTNPWGAQQMGPPPRPPTGQQIIGAPSRIPSPPPGALPNARMAQKT